LKPLAQNAARQTFADIADGGHDPEAVDKVLSLADNLPLAITLLAHLVDSEGCAHVLAQWDPDKTSLVSEGYDRRDNLDLSISLSLSSPRIQRVPRARDLLSLLAILPDGLSDTELLQSKLPMDDILRCKATLIRTALAYSDEDKRLKVLMPIREYMRRFHPPNAHIIRPLFKHFQELLEFFMAYVGNLSGPQAVTRISANYANIHSLLVNGLGQDGPDLVDIIYCACYMNHFSMVTGNGNFPLMDNIRDILPRLRDPRLEVYFIAELFYSWRYHPVSDPETLIRQGLQNFDRFDDPDLKCTFYDPHLFSDAQMIYAGRFYNDLAYYHHVYKHDIPTAQIFCQQGLSLAISTANDKRRSDSSCRFASIQWQCGNYSVAQSHAYEARRHARIAADLYKEAQALRIEALCKRDLGNYEGSISLCTRARHLLALSGVSGGGLDHVIMNSQAEVHRVKSEYSEARNIHAGILREMSVEQDPVIHGMALHNLAQIDVQIGAPVDIVRKNNDTAKTIFNTAGSSKLVQWCEVIEADLELREGHLLEAGTLFQKGLRFSWGKDSAMVSSCLDGLSAVERRTGTSTCQWTTVFFAHSLKSKKTLDIYKGLQSLGYFFLTQRDLDTANALSTVALEGFACMDVHRSKAECMLQLAEIFMENGETAKAVEHWREARPLFERSSQAERVAHIDTLLAGITDRGIQVSTATPEEIAYLGDEKPGEVVRVAVAL
jgi:tetratricopeptide (TPR) repeat protein